MTSRHLADDAAGRDDRVAPLDARSMSRCSFAASAVGGSQEIHDDQDQDERQQICSNSPPPPAPPGLCKGGSDEHEPYIP